jgi:2,4'-dihydroxyacetophenone dioxygenase
MNEQIDFAAAAAAPPVGGDADRVPYQKPQPWGMAPDMVVPDLLTEDPRLWAPVGQQMWSRPIHLNVTGGFYVHLLRVARSGLLQRHRHSGQVHAYVIRGRWRYLEHDWTAEEGGYVFEPPGETHTLVVPADCTDMITLFTVSGSLMYVDPQGNATGYDDVFTRIDRYRAHFESVGLGGDYVRRFMR